MAAKKHAGPRMTIPTQLVLRALLAEPTQEMYGLQICEQAGLGRWTLHELRHSCASLLLAMGVPLEVVSETLGHSSIRVTKDVYGHLLAPARAAAADAMARALWSKENDSQQEALATHLATRPEADDSKDPLTRENVGRPGLEPGTLGLKVPCST